MITRDEVVEARARAICCPRGCRFKKRSGSKDPHLYPTLCEAKHHEGKAEATMQADDGLGLALVPYGATLVMQNAACSNFNKIAGLNAAIAAGNLLTKEKQDGD